MAGFTAKKAPAFGKMPMGKKMAGPAPKPKPKAMAAKMPMVKTAMFSGTTPMPKAPKTAKKK